ncbi:Rab GTPase-binding effector protein 1, partial [Xenoophorus captivus]
WVCPNIYCSGFISIPGSSCLFLLAVGQDSLPLRLTEHSSLEDVFLVVFRHPGTPNLSSNLLESRVALMNCCFFPLTCPPEVLQQRVAALEQEKAEFIQFKQQLEVEFNQKRAKFKELFLSKEEELKRQTVALENSQSELSSLQAQLAQAQAEIETIKAVATVSENTKQEAIDQVRSQWQEEVASLQAIMKDTVCEYEVQFHQRLEQERAQWNQYREAMERELGDLRRRLTEVQEEENLEVEMKKAQEDAEKLRSVVMPMEQEITVLKAKLSTAEERVKELEASKEEDEKERLSLVKDLQEDDGGDNTEPLEDFLGLSVEEVRASCHLILPPETHSSLSLCYVVLFSLVVM